MLVNNVGSFGASARARIDMHLRPQSNVHAQLQQRRHGELKRRCIPTH